MVIYLEHITSRQNPEIKEVSKLMKSASARRESGLFVVEGVRLCEEAVSHGMVYRIYYTEKNSMRPFLGELPAIAQVTVSESVFSKMSDTVSGQGMLAVCKMPAWPVLHTPLEKKTYLFLDGVSDPGNMGTIIRTASAFGIEKVFMTMDCVDIYNPKVLRSGMGGIFKVACYVDETEKLLKNFSESGLLLVGATMSERSIPVQKADHGSCVLVIGNEGRGISREVLKACDFEVSIPMEENVESLNASVAAAIIMWEFTK